MNGQKMTTKQAKGVLAIERRAGRCLRSKEQEKKSSRGARRIDNLIRESTSRPKTKGEGGQDLKDWIDTRSDLGGNSTEKVKKNRSETKTANEPCNPKQNQERSAQLYEQTKLPSVV